MRQRPRRYAAPSVLEVRRTASVASLSLLLAACVWVPVPWVEHRYDRDEIEALQVGTATREDVKALLADPLIESVGGRYSAYRWWEDRGKDVLWPAPSKSGFDASTIYEKLFVLLFEFDDQGLVARREFGRPVDRKGPGADWFEYSYCTRDGLCLEHWPVEEGLRRIRTYGDILTVSGGAANSLPLPTIRGDECLVVTWPAPGDWDAASGVSVGMGEPRSEIRAQVPPGAFAAFTVPVGGQFLHVTSPRIDLDNARDESSPDGAGRYRCVPGQTVYLEIGALKRGDVVPSGVTLRQVEASAAVPLIAGMRRVIPPESPH